MQAGASRLGIYHLPPGERANLLEALILHVQKVSSGFISGRGHSDLHLGFSG